MVEYEVDDSLYVLEQGDVLLFETTLPHRWRNPAKEETAEMLLILQASEESDEPIRRHSPKHPSLTYIE